MAKKVMRKSAESTDRIRTGAAYIRVSTDDQLEYSPESQLEEIKRYCLQHNILLPSEYIFVEEDGRSGRKSSNRYGKDQAEALRCHCPVEVQPVCQESGREYFLQVHAPEKARNRCGIRQ